MSEAYYYLAAFFPEGTDMAAVEERVGGFCVELEGAGRAVEDLQIDENIVERVRKDFPLVYEYARKRAPIIGVKHLYRSPCEDPDWKGVVVQGNRLAIEAHLFGHPSFQLICDFIEQELGGTADWISEEDIEPMELLVRNTRARFKKRLEREAIARKREQWTLNA